ncbi:hypothetical protein [Streptomyces gibsoniae]|uniref:Uncharacterized protein n=1 Tax=Streptomyces gibsoniae TaxID=3075529 RepID=A0ABU2U5D7_9ACTN|nr:hypothetical protein [Streptomyces sp. DSM 41699]MDT0468441.1 hypothetical protein [Streptomyces sp. DSM 41699]
MFVGTSSLLDEIGGCYFEGCDQALPHDDGPEAVGVADHALDPEAAQRLRDMSALSVSD